MTFINKNPYFMDEISRILKKNGLEEATEENKRVFYCDVSYGKRNSYEKCEIVNQLADVNILGNKKMQYDNFMKYYKTRPLYMPETISFSRDNIDNISSVFMRNPGESRKMWVIKPENGLARGGVNVIRSHLELIKHLGEYDHKDWILQEYIDKPLLLNEKKFHFRVYIIFVQSNEYQVAYIGKKGFIYTANKKYSPNTVDKDVVLSGEDGRENVMYTPDDFVEEYGKKMWDEIIFPQFVKITRETLKSVLNDLECPNRKKCFKILGYDILVDRNKKCYLAEINARNVSYKYPNENFKKSFYKNILKLVLAKKPLTNKELVRRRIPYERILYQYDGNVIEGFNGLIKDYGKQRKNKFGGYYGYVIFPVILIVLIIITFQIRK